MLSLSFAQPARIFAGNYSDYKGADIVVVTTGAAQKQGETRLNLVSKNTDISKDIIPKIAAHEPGTLLIISNPVNICRVARALEPFCTSFRTNVQLQGLSGPPAIFLTKPIQSPTG